MKDSSGIIVIQAFQCRSVGRIGKSVHLFQRLLYFAGGIIMGDMEEEFTVEKVSVLFEQNNCM